MATPNIPSPDALLAQRIVNSSRQAVLLLDGDARVVAASPSFCSEFHIDGTPVGMRLATLGQGEWNVPQLHSLLEVALFDGPPIDVYEMDLERAGAAARHLQLHAQKVETGSSKNDMVLLTIDDVSEARNLAVQNRILLRQNDEMLREKEQLVRDRDLLLEEMRHRIANSLQIIASILILKARGVQSEESRKHLQDAHDRVLTIASIQDQLREGLVDLEVGPYLTKLCNTLSASMIREYRPITLSVSASSIVVNPHVAVSLGLVVTELVINALKHAFPEGRTGNVLVRYESGADGWLISVEDDGIGMSCDEDEVHFGLGTSMVAALASQMDAVVATSDCMPGTKVTLTHRIM